MKQKSNYTERRQHDRSKTQSIVVDVLKSKDFVKNERIDLLKQIYAEWLEKRNYGLNIYKEIYLINEPDELDTEGYW
jgi:hypothetical protein